MRSAPKCKVEKGWVLPEMGYFHLAPPRSLMCDETFDCSPSCHDGRKNFICLYLLSAGVQQPCRGTQISTSVDLCVNTEFSQMRACRTPVVLVGPLGILKVLSRVEVLLLSPLLHLLAELFYTSCLSSLRVVWPAGSFHVCTSNRVHQYCVTRFL